MGSGPVVVVLLTHRDPPLIRRIIDRILQGDDVAVVVHHDPRGPELELPRSPQVLRVPDPVEGTWGRIGLADAVFSGLHTAHALVPELGWALVISGQDYPCRPMASIEAELRAPGSADAYVRWFRIGPPDQDVVPWQRLTRARYLHHRRLPGSHRHIPMPRRHPFRNGLDLYVGDMWPNLSARALDHVIAQEHRLPQVRRYLATCQAPDEALLTTLLLNDAEDLQVANDRKRFIRWVPGTAHPATLQLADGEEIMASGDFFARKVDPSASAELMDRLDSPDSPDSVDSVDRVEPTTGED